MSICSMASVTVTTWSKLSRSSFSEDPAKRTERSTSSGSRGDTYPNDTNGLFLTKQSSEVLTYTNTFTNTTLLRWFYDTMYTILR